jgi:ATPase subunit of ABC transporter with duplicated ATPase domains
MAKDHIQENEPRSRSTAERFLETVKLKSGPKGESDPLVFSPANVNLFVGPNHAGKSLLLREIQIALQDPEQAAHRKVLQQITFSPFDEKRRSILADQIRAASKQSQNRPDANVVLSKAHWSEEYSRSHFEEMLRGVTTMRDVGDHPHFRRFF